ncbi:hypothetical protein HNV12_13940 [Methanococcoides sp. SA1]|nr:hypothetical protein [Methanococcoides sp. SA1]
MNKHIIKYYPVDNGDTSLIKLSDNKTIQIDCQIRDGKENSNGIKIYDVKKDLIKELQKDGNNNPFVDLFILSHPHKDHCLGFEDNYYCGNPEDYDDDNRKNEDIIIGELWITQMIFSNDICDQAKAIRKEAKRRRKLFEDNPAEANKHGNRLKIIGYNDNDKTVENLHYVPGETVNTFNGNQSDFLEFFIHAPFKSDLVTGKAEKDQNATSIVLHASFCTTKNGTIKTKAFFGGDADHYIWEKVLRKSENNGNENKLKWDLFLAPHHCSWTFFNDTPYDENKTPTDYSLELLDYKNSNAYVVASSIKIEDDDNNPPHYPARKEYIKKVGSDYFKNTGVNKGEKAPKPLEFEIGNNGIKFLKGSGSASAGILGSSTPRAGKNGL